ncbi:MAG: hypothetical protein RL148_1065 [Planctomycetota bacterium]|jgi:hypothetical protein
MSTHDKGGSDDFLKEASHGKQQGLVGEFVSFMKENKVWWLTPILLVLGLVGALLLLAGTGVAPFIYTLF